MRTRKLVQSKSEPNVVQIADHLGEADRTLVDEPKAATRADGDGQEPLSELFVEATKLPNIDGRPSVLVDLPKDLFVEGRADFAVEDIEQLSYIRFGKPASDEWVRCHPEHVRIMHCIKAKKDRELYPVTKPMLKFKQLAMRARLYWVRLAVIYDSDEILCWPCPMPGRRSFPGDQDHRRAMNCALTRWTQMWWAERSFKHVAATEKDEKEMGLPRWPEQPYDDIVAAAVAELLIKDPEHDYAKDLLRGKFED